MGYNPYRWWTSGKKKKKLSVKEHLYDRIKNGDFDYSYYYSEAEAARKQSSDLYNSVMDGYYKGGEKGDYWGYVNEARQKSYMKNVRANKLDEEGHRDEIKTLDLLKKELEKEFGFCLWDKVMKSRLMDAEQVYEFYLIEKLNRQSLVNK